MKPGQKIRIKTWEFIKRETPAHRTGFFSGGMSMPLPPKPILKDVVDAEFVQFTQQYNIACAIVKISNTLKVVDISDIVL